MRILVVADTHNKLPPRVLDLAREADEIWHLGDVCAGIILDELRAIGPPVTVVRGNCDSNSEWPLVMDLARDGFRFRLQHIPPDEPPENVDVVLHGHTHVPRNEKRAGVWFLNPGCVTRPNRGAPPSVAWLQISNGKTQWRLVPL
jgi:putative phosphoesterase